MVNQTSMLGPQLSTSTEHRTHGASDVTDNSSHDDDDDYDDDH